MAYNPTGAPGQKASLASAAIRAEFALIAAAFAMLPDAASVGAGALPISNGSAFVAATTLNLPIGTVTRNTGAFTSVDTNTLQVAGLGQAVAGVVDGGARGATLYLEDTGTSAGSGGSIIFGAFSSGSPFAGIKGYITDATPATTGDLVFTTRRAPTDGSLTEAMRVRKNGHVSVGSGGDASLLSIYGGASGVDTRFTVANAGAVLQIGIDGGNIGLVGGPSMKFYTPAGVVASMDETGLMAISRLQVNTTSGFNGNVQFNAGVTFVQPVNYFTIQGLNSGPSAPLLTLADTGGAGANLALRGNTATTPSKYIRAFNGNFEILNDAYSAILMRISDAGVVTVGGYFGGNLAGNATTATTLQTARTINGVPFDGSANISISAVADAGSLTGATLNAGVTASSLTSVGTLGTLAVAGTIRAGVGGNGYGTISPGDSTHSGYFASFKADGTRVGYLGFASSDNVFHLVNDLGGAFEFNNGPVTIASAGLYVAGVITAAGGITGNVTGNVSGSASFATNATNATNASTAAACSGNSVTASLAGALSYGAGDSIGEIGYKGLPGASINSGAFNANDRGRCVYANGGVTVPNVTMSQGDAVTILNTLTTAITITQASGLTMYLAGTNTTGNRTLAPNGICTVVFRAAGGGSCIISGNVS